MPGGQFVLCATLLYWTTLVQSRVNAGAQAIKTYYAKYSVLFLKFVKRQVSYLAMIQWICIAEKCAVCSGLMQVQA